MSPVPRMSRSLVLALLVLPVAVTAAIVGWIFWSAAAPGAPIRFTDVTASAGIGFTHENGARGGRFMPETTVGGAGWIDHDGDGLLDIYLVNGNLHPASGGQGEAANRLYRNLGGGRFRDVTREAGVGDRGYGAGLAVGDYDNDGDSDLFVTNVGPDVLYRNDGNGRFTDVSAAAGVAGEGWSSSAAFVDVDGDGWLDLYVCRYVDYDPTRSCRTGDIPTYCSPGEFPGLPDALYRNRGDGTFEDRSAAAGVAIAGPTEGKSLGVIALDYDGDGDQDLYVACDQTPNLMLRNRGDGTFEEVGLLANTAYSREGGAQAGMGVDAGDVDLDGDLDIVVTNFSDERCALYLNGGGGFFEEMSTAFGLGGPTLTPLGFGIVLLDADLDGDLDLAIANGHVLDNIGAVRPGMVFAQRDLVLENLDGERFEDVSSSAGEWFSRRVVSRALASADFDEDGDEDLLVLASGGPAVLLRNDSPRALRHWIAFRLSGRTSNRDGYGARVRITVRRRGRELVRVAECRSARSYASACDPRVRFGLGGGRVEVERVEIRWPSGVRQTVLAPAIDTVHEVVEPAPQTGG